jgi:hypothetical protein
MKQRWMKLVLASISLGISIGCASTRVHQAYSGEPQPMENQAVVFGTTNTGFRLLPGSTESITFVAVNDRNTTPWFSLSDPPNVLHLLPGRHKVDVQFEYVHGVARGPVWVDARSNHCYRVKAMTTEGRTQRVYFLVEDITAQNVVGGPRDATSTP